jgi:hypothetical protein
MGESPEERFQSAAKSTINRALKSQKKTTKQLAEQQGEFLGKNAPQNYAQSIREIGSASGRTFPKYVRTVEDRFFNTARALTEQGRRDLRNFSPNLLASESTSQLTDYLSAIGQDFARGVQQVGEQGRDRLFALPEQAQKAFTASSKNPAFENLANEQYMNFAKNPPTVQNDAMAMYRGLWTYNV